VCELPLQLSMAHGLNSLAISTSHQVGLVRTRRSAGTLGGFAFCTIKDIARQMRKAAFALTKATFLTTSITIIENG
jgi:hypothetical protein